MLSFSDLRIPPDWTLVVGFDTGAYMSATITAFCPDPYCALTVWEGPNYRYVGGEIEHLGLSNAEWARDVLRAYRFLRPGTTKVHGWVDTNSQFKFELARYNLHLHGNPRKLELRVEIAREYVQAHDPYRWWMAPWLTVLPYEMEHATWPDEATSAGKFERVKQNDHTLDCLEHTLSRRPRTKRILEIEKKETLREMLWRTHRRTDRDISPPDRHLGYKV